MKYNLDKLNELSGGDKEFNQTIISTFLQETPEDFKGLESAVVAQDFSAIYQYAHKIKPNADLLGIDKLKDQMLTIESHARGDMDIESIRALSSGATTELEEAYKELNNYIK
ncbi:Hpt domain-containing protein [Galbibacter sp.]|jgi:HPt (histidine-containing phosphotransfer) domain-containing protein|uniref:Hpt domain-containing protein n=1 Tax=Galbibacter sp. TaxID=2918471 RepID=UPI003A95A42B